MLKVEVLMGNVEVSWKMRISGSYGEKSRFRWENGGLWGFMEENGGFGGKIGVFMGFWSRNWEKVGKSREFDDFLKIGENRKK